MSGISKDKVLNEVKAGKKKGSDRLLYGLFAICGLLLIAEFFYKKKAGLAIEAVPALNVIFGFITILAVVISVRIIRWLVMRKEDYYAPNDTDSEDYPQEGTSRETIHD